MKYKTIGSVLLCALLTSGFTACSDNNTSTLTGYYLDGAVANLDYITSSGITGVTGDDGSFTCNTGDTVTFKIGNVTLKTLSSITDGQKFIENNDSIMTLLQSIDQDGDPANGIQLTTEIKNVVSTWLEANPNIEINSSNDMLNNIDSLETSLNDAGITTNQSVTMTQAREHVQTTITAELASSTTSSVGTQVIVGDTINYIDAKNAVRQAPLSAAAAEYHTGTGYGHTLFDSADNKCQNCHNELYDTWKGSMHGNSWSDPIFQSKYQDFLRTQINKIEEDKTASVGVDGITGIVYSEAMISKVALTCVKCHAPAAYYAGDFKATLTTLQTGADTAALTAAQDNNQSNLATTTTTYDPTQPASVVAVSHTNGKLYQLTYQIGHVANREGINCAFCHSIETPRLMGLTQDQNANYTLASHIRVGPHGPAKASAGTVLNYSKDATTPDMNKFFRLWGPEKYSNPAATPKSSTDYDQGKAADGRYTMASKDINGTNGKVHFTGGPFYGPFGVTGIRNENETDDTNRSALVHPDFDYATNNHFGGNAKTLCLSCHQRSAGAAVPSGEDGAGSFMELCSTWNAVTTGSDDNIQDTMSSPKCTKCHMERIEGTVLHQWASPDKLFTDKSLLTEHFYADDSEGFGDDNPVASGWLNSHGFLGASKTGGDKTAAVAKIKSGFGADIATSVDGNTLTVTTTFTNKTAHMFPGAHPMRRALTRVIVTDQNGTMLPLLSATGNSTFADITNNIATLSGKTLHSSAEAAVTLNENGSADLDFPGKVDDLNGSSVSSQKFTAQNVIITGADTTLTAQYIDGTNTMGTVFNAAITTSSDATNFTRIYGHETGKKYDINGTTTFVVRPGFDSNMVERDDRLSPNETETYTLTYDISNATGVSATYKVYYMQKGANGKFLTGSDGWLDQALSDSKKLLVTEVFSKTVTE